MYTAAPPSPSPSPRTRLCPAVVSALRSLWHAMVTPLPCALCIRREVAKKRSVIVCALICCGVDARHAPISLRGCVVSHLCAPHCGMFVLRPAPQSIDHQSDVCGVKEVATDACKGGIAPRCGDHECGSFGRAAPSATSPRHVAWVLSDDVDVSSPPHVAAVSAQVRGCAAWSRKVGSHDSSFVATAGGPRPACEGSQACGRSLVIVIKP